MNRRIFIVSISAMQLFRGLMVLINEATMDITAMNVLSILCGRRATVIVLVYLAAVTLALGREFWRSQKTLLSQIWYVPQAGLLTLSAVGSLICMFRGSYADMEPRPFEFIAADQVMTVMLAGMYFKTLSKP